MYRDSATLEEIHRLALPNGTEIIYGETMLQQSASWACSLRPSPPAFPNLVGNEMALIDMDDLSQLDPRMRLDRVIQSLRQAQVAAVCVRGPLAEDMKAVAERHSMPLFHLPLSVPLMQVERTIIRLIVDREGYVASRTAELQRRLTQASLDDAGIDTIADIVHRFCLQPVALVQEDGQLVALAGLSDQEKRRRERVVAGLPNLTSMRSWAAGATGDVDSIPIGRLPLVGSGDLAYPEAVLAPVSVGDRVQGYCLLLRPREAKGTEVTAIESAAARQCAEAAAMEWSRQNAVGAVQQRMQTAFLDEILASEVADEQAWIQRGSALGYNLRNPHVAWVVDCRNLSDWPTPLVQFLAEQKEKIPVSHRPEGTVFFWPGDNPKSGRSFKSIAADLVSHLRSASSQAQVVIGIGRPALSPSEWLRSLQQARESWRMGTSWGAVPVTYFGDLGLYQLLTALGPNPETARFFRKTVQPLIDHDRSRNSEFVETLEAFFACHGNLSQTANSLHIHRNTLAYRLERIAAISQLDLNDPDARFALQLALKLQPVVKG